ncbi:Pleckstrin domain [Trinorchestia longiramus]|nr:Pleckstrin domain [Trinorchestia longiramus]
MQEMFSYVLNKKDLSKAGDLFQVPDRVILNDLSAIINKVIEITSQPDYSHNLNDQSVVEICITRITSAIRENGSVEEEGLSLVSLLQTCLNHNLRPTTPDAAPPHAKIAADIVACIFLHYQQRSVMRLALPVAVKLLHKGNSELSRSISSYLSLAAIHSAALLAQHTHTIVDSVIAGNYSLARILPGLYSEAQEPLQRHIMTLVSLLPRCHNHSDTQPLLQLFALVAGHKPALLENSLPQLLECLVSPSTVLPTLQVVLLLTRWRPTILTPYMHRIMDAVDSQPEALTIGLQVICVLGRVSADGAQPALCFIAKHLTSVERSGLAEVLREVASVVSLYPGAVNNDLLLAIRQCESTTAHPVSVSGSHASLQHDDDETARIKHSNSGGVTIVTINSNELGLHNNLCYTSSSNNNLEHVSNGKLESRDFVDGAREVAGVAGLASITGSRDQISYARYRGLVRSTSRELANSHFQSRDLLPAKDTRINDGGNSLYLQNPSAGSGGGRQYKYQKHGGASTVVVSSGEAWKSSNKLVTASNRSMPRLGAASGPSSGSSGRLGSSSVLLNKSLTRLNGSHHALTTAATTTTTTTITRSVTGLTTITQTTRPLSTPFTSSSSPTTPPSLYNNGFCATIDAMSPYATQPVTHFPSALPALGIPLPTAGSFPPLGISAVSSNLPAGGHMSVSSGVSSHKRFSAHLPISVSVSAAAQQRLPPIMQSSGTGSGFYTSVAAPNKMVTGATYTAANSGRPLIEGIPLRASCLSDPISVPASLCSYKSRSSSVGTLRDYCVTAADSTNGLGGLTSSPACTTTHTTTRTTTHTTTHTTTTTIAAVATAPLTSYSSGGVTSASSGGSICDSAGSISPPVTSNGTGGTNPIDKTSTLGSVAKLRLKQQAAADLTGAHDTNINYDSEAKAVLRAPAAGAAEPQRASVFEPFAMKDTVQHFCEKHREKIKAYMQKVFVKLPLPVKCLIEERKRRKYAKLFFGCQGKGEHCLYNSQLFCIKVRHPRVWIHLMFLALQARSPSALSSRETQVSSLRHCWDSINSDANVSFLTLVTTAFPSAKDMDSLMQDLRSNRFFDVFEYNGIEQQWGCFLCNHPDKAQGFVQENTPVIEGQLKEKKSKWKLFRKWRTRYFTLSGAHLSYRGEHDDRIEEKGDIDVQRIRSVKVGKSGRHIPKAFEIFTDNKSFVLKAKDSSNAEEWVRCLSIVVAQQQVRERSGDAGGALYSSNSMPLHHPSHSYRANRVSAASTEGMVYPGIFTENQKRCGSGMGRSRVEISQFPRSVHSSSSSVWPGTTSRLSSNTSLPRSLLFNPHGGGLPSSSPPGTLPPHLANRHSTSATPFAAALLSQHAAAAAAAAASHAPPEIVSAGNKSSSNTLPAGVTLVRSNV